MPGPGTMTCIDHGKKVGGNPQANGEPLDLTPLAQALGGMTAAACNVVASLDRIEEAIAGLKLAVQVDAPIVNVTSAKQQAPHVTVMPAPVTVQIDKQVAPIVNVEAPRLESPNVVVNPILESGPVALHHTTVEKPSMMDWLLCAIPVTVLICDIVLRIIHP